MENYLLYLINISSNVITILIIRNFILDNVQFFLFVDLMFKAKKKLLVGAKE